jgi:hypothetical protein
LAATEVGNRNDVEVVRRGDEEADVGGDALWIGATEVDPLLGGELKTLQEVR